MDFITGYFFVSVLIFLVLSLSNEEGLDQLTVLADVAIALVWPISLYVAYLIYKQDGGEY